GSALRCNVCIAAVFGAAPWRRSPRADLPFHRFPGALIEGQELELPLPAVPMPGATDPFHELGATHGQAASRAQAPGLPLVRVLAVQLAEQRVTATRKSIQA